MLWRMQREWNKQYRDNVTKVVGWPSHMYESFIIVVRDCMDPACSHQCANQGDTTVLACSSSHDVGVSCIMLVRAADL